MLPASEAASATTQLLRRVARSPSLLALDHDGTIAPFRADRAAATPAPELMPALTKLARTTATRLVIVSGRPVDDLEGLLGIDPLPELFGVHGWEHRDPDGTRRDIPVPAKAAAVLAVEYECLRERGLAPHVERKCATLALHWRGLDHAQARELESTVGARWRTLAAEHGMALRPFDGGIELRQPGRDKGDVMRELLASTRPGAAVAYLGDDDTDEDAFRVLRGRGLGVLVAAKARSTAAEATIHPRQVAAFLDAWLRAAQGNDG